MNVHEAVADVAIRQACYDFLLARYEQDLVDDAYQQACTDMLKSPTPPTFESWEKARNYFVCAVNSRAGNIFHRQTLQIATSDRDFLGDDSPVARVPDERPNALEALCIGEREGYLVQQVQAIIATLSPIARCTMRAMLIAMEEGADIITTIQRECNCSYETARGRYNNAYKRHFSKFKALYPLIGARPLLS